MADVHGEPPVETALRTTPASMAAATTMMSHPHHGVPEYCGESDTE